MESLARVWVESLHKQLRVAEVLILVTFRTYGGGIYKRMTRGMHHEYGIKQVNMTAIDGLA